MFARALCRSLCARTLTMSAQPGTVEIPIHREPKTFEKHRRDMLTKLEQSSSTPNGTQSKHNHNHQKEIQPFHDNWFHELNRWANSSWSRWDDEMRRMRQNMFALLPLHHFGVVNLHHPPATRDLEKLMYDMEHHMQEIRERMGLTEASGAGSLSDYLKDAYEVGEDGLVHFKVRFDTSGFSPEEIKVTSTDNRLTVLAKKTTETDKSKSSREYCRIIELPRSIDQTQLKCNLTEDGVLMLEAPVKSPDYKSITFNEDRKLGIRPHSDKESPVSHKCTTLAVKGVCGPTILGDDASGKKLHVEVPIDGIFDPEDLCVNVDSNRVVITGRRHKLTGGRLNRMESVAEFKQSYEIPETVDPLSVHAQLVGQTLVIEAPLSMEHKVELQTTDKAHK